LVLSACGGVAASVGASATHRKGSSAPFLDGTVLSTPVPEPPLVLRDSRGHLVNITNYRGRAVLVTFLYTHCPDTCPLTTAKLQNALAMLGPQAARVQIIAVSRLMTGYKSIFEPALIAHDVPRLASV
jgi:protein SCO1